MIGRRAVRALVAVLAAEAVAVAALAGLGEVRHRAHGAARRTARRLVSELMLTDLSLWTEAGYCRHPSQADGFAAFADHPASMEHFPAGSFVPPPERRRP